ncbi:flavodoxin domain-containing protein [Haloferax sp. DFSO60]|uniref:flavodoxin domain-containing protein n=1 Tax=Haloferax sp. DFSO60 TaxID=3388652 RepID=UPI00397D5547
MVSILVAYGTGEGQTAKVSKHITTVLEARGHEVTSVNVTDDPDVDVEPFDAVLVGSPVNNRKHRPAVVAFVERNRAALEARPNGFFQLSLASIIPLRWAREGAGKFVDDLTDRTGWHPDRVGLFAGAVAYTKYPPMERVIFKLVSAVTTGDTDTSRDYEYTDWDDVSAFATEFAEFVESTVGSKTVKAGKSEVRRVVKVVAGTALVVALVGVVYELAVRRPFLHEC